MNLERRFEKELAGDLRKETADKIREARKGPRSLKDLNSGKSLSPGQETPEVKDLIEDVKKSIFGKIFKTESFRNKESLLNDVLRSKMGYDIRDIREEYKKRFDDILNKCPLAPEERDRYLSTEAMEEMSLEDYLTLLKRLSGESFYHVTRYGVRENVHADHSRGEGTFVNSFLPLLKDGNIKDATTTILSDADDKETARWMVRDEYIKRSKENGVSIEEVVQNWMDHYDTEYFLDTESTHFSYGTDKHLMYGGENDYKFYFYYPVEYILHNDFYQDTRQRSIVIGGDDPDVFSGVKSRFNDFEIFNFGNGVPINAGILCISHANVDPNTGSQYILEDGKPVVGEDGEFERPQKTISSQEYWEEFFKKHPELKPSKVIYSEFSSPHRVSGFESGKNSELQQLAESKKISKQGEDKKKEFLEYKKKKMEELRVLFTEVVKEKYQKL